ncbi:hypothetical protein ACFPOB_11420 [Bosea eneae]|uniref:Uncharacterized protein n=1 Tax=Bosea eneae TaxID=151454 RepID=A0ABW0IPI5_9HYPH
MDSREIISQREASLLELALESWRFQRLFGRALAKLDPLEAARFTNQHRYFVGKIESCLADAGMRFVSHEGQIFETGTAATPLNIDDFEAEDVVVVVETIEPTVMNTSGLVRMGSVMLRKVNS